MGEAAERPALQIPGNGVDDDRNGYIDDVHGFNFLANSGDPMDNNFHGTHLAGARPSQGFDPARANGVHTACAPHIIGEDVRLSLDKRM